MGVLFDKMLEFENLKQAWAHTRSQGQAPGVDEISAQRFDRRWEEHLRELAAEVRANRYQPRPLRVRFIPKPTGGQRRLAIPTMRDRVLQRAALQVLEWRFERKFMACSYGYRPKRSLFHATAAVMHFRDRGLRWVLDADIDDCFDSLDHDLLRGLVRREISEAPVLRLIEQWLEVGMVDREQKKGIGQGMPISPLLCNVYLHELDWQLVRGRWALVRYADDFIVCTHSEEMAERCREVVAEVLGELKLALEPRKTRVTSFDAGFTFLGVAFAGEGFSYTWEGKRVAVKGKQKLPWALWDYFPHGYEEVDK